jgi:hypothetical protein
VVLVAKLQGILDGRMRGEKASQSKDVEDFPDVIPDGTKAKLAFVAPELFGGIDENPKPCAGYIVQLVEIQDKKGFLPPP